MRNNAMEAGTRPAGRSSRPGRVVAFEPRRGDAAGLRLVELVARERRVPARLLLHQSRCEAQVALARQLAMYLMHVVLERIYADVGRFFERDRTTVSHACALIEDLREDRVFDAAVERIEAQFRAEATPEEERRHAAR